MTQLKPTEYNDELMTSLRAQRIFPTDEVNANAWHAYPRLSGALLAHCIYSEGPLRLDVVGRTYCVHDTSTQRSFHLTFPQRSVRPLTTDTMDDGSFPCEVWKIQDLDAPYLIFWLYPHSVKVHVWAVYEDGRRRNGFDLPSPSATQFCRVRSGRNLMFAYRALLAEAAEKENR